MFRVRVHLAEIAHMSYGGKKFKFFPEYDVHIPTEERFHKGTPSGGFEILVNNPAAIEYFKLGEEYYIEFSPAPHRDRVKTGQG